MRAYLIVVSLTAALVPQLGSAENIRGALIEKLASTTKHGNNPVLCSGAQGNLYAICSIVCPCDSGLSCQPGIPQKCYHSPRQFEEPCSAGFDCGSGLSCQPVEQKCYNDPRHYGQPCDDGLGFFARTLYSATVDFARTRLKEANHAPPNTAYTSCVLPYECFQNDDFSYTCQ